MSISVSSNLLALRERTLLDKILRKYKFLTLFMSITMDSSGPQPLDNYTGSDERSSRGENDRLLRILYESTCYKTADSCDFTPKTSCFGRENHLDFEERIVIEDKIRSIIRRNKKLRKLFCGTEDLPILKGMDFELLTVDNRVVVIGEGKSGVAYLAKNIHSDKLVAIKLFKKKDTMKDILEEVGFQMVIDKKSKSSFSPRILGMLFLRKSKIPKDFHSCMLVMEYLSVLPNMEKPMKLSLSEANAFRRKGCDVLREKDWVQICKQLIKITKELTDMKICHMDLHANNVLLVFEQGRINVKVIDFGRCVWLDGVSQLKGYVNVKSKLVGREFTEQQHPLPTSDLFFVSDFIFKIYWKALGWKKSAAVMQRFRKQPFRHRWSHNQLSSNLALVQQ